MAEKKFFVDINLQGNKLVNPVVGSNASMTAEGSFQYNAGRLEYYNGSTVQEVANLNDIAAVTGGLILQGGYNAATNTPDIAADSSVLKGFFWVVTAAGSFLGEAVQVGDSIIAKQDNPGATAANWLILQGNVVIATDSVDGISRLATQAEADAGTEGGAVVITPATLQGKIDAQITPEINDKLSKQGGTMSGAINMGTNDITNVGNIGSVATPVSRVDSQTVTASNGTFTNSLGSFDGSSNINLENGLDAANTHSITNLPAPSNGGDAANKTYVDDNTNNKLPLAGGTMTGNIDMGNNVIDNVNRIVINAAPIDGDSATNKSYVDNQDALKVSKAGDTMSGLLNMANNVIANLGTPVDGGDATNKTYVDGVGATAESNANAYTDTAIENNSYRTEINFADWTLNGSQYEFEVTHNITSTGYPVVTFTDENDITVEAVYQAISGTAIKVIVNNRPSVLGVSLGAANPRV